MPTSILVVDDHALVRSGLRTVLDAEGDLEVVGEASDGFSQRSTEAAARGEAERPERRKVEPAGTWSVSPLAVREGRPV